MKLLLIRHGESVNNVSKKYTGQMDAPLTDTGRAQARAIRPVLEALPIEKAYSSDLCRAAETQQLALPALEGEQLPLLQEINVGFLAGMDIQEVRERYADEFRQPRDFTPFGGENGEMLRERARTFLKMMEESPYEYVAAFAHGGIITAMLEVILEAQINHHVTASGNCAIHVFEYRKGKWHLRAWNYMGDIV